MPEKNTIGHKIKNIIEMRELSAEQIAKNSGVNQLLVEQIIEGEIIPSLTPLTKIARALGVRLGTFLDDNPKDDPIIIRKGESNQVIHFSGDESSIEESHLQFYSLGAGKPDRHMEPFIIDIQEDHKEDIELASHEGEEFIYVLQGSIELIYGKNTHVLNVGDSLYYDSIVPHHLHANGEKAVILTVLYTPS